MTLPPIRNPKDGRSLLWSLVFFPVFPAVGLTHPQWWLMFVPVGLYLGFCAGVLAHYHNHRGVFHSDILNRLYSVWLSVFYGFPIFSWIPTHNQNHHKFVNGPGDTTSTLRRAQKDTLYEAVTYPSRSSRWQAPTLALYVRKLHKKRSRALPWAIAQGLAIVFFHLAVIVWSLGRADSPQALSAYVLLVLLPALFAPWSMMFINYVQHVGCNHACPNNHSRNFVGAWENWLVFDAGLHTVHHENPGAHWSQYQELHDRRGSVIHPHLCQRNVFTFLWRHYWRGEKTLTLTESNNSATL